MAGQDVFKGALGLDDWVWWSIIGGVALLVLLLLVCCCVCVQRAKRKGHEEALATVQRRQREAEQRRAQQQQFAQLQQQAQASAVAPTDAYGGGNNYAKPVNAVPLAPPPNRKNMGPQVAANGYLQPQQQQQPYATPPYQQRGQQPPYQQQYVQPQAPYAQHPYGYYPPPAPQQQYAAPAAAAAAAAAVYRAPPPQQQQHQEQFQKPYPALPQQQQQQRQQQPPPPPVMQFHEPEKEAEAPPKPMKRRYHPPTRWYNALAANANANDGAAAAAASEPLHANSPSSSSYHNTFAEDASAAHENSIDSIRYDPYGAQGNLNSAPFVSVTSPTAGNNQKKKPALAKTGNTAPATGAAQLPPPVVVATKYQSAPSMPAPSAASSDGHYGGPRGGSEVNARTNGSKYGTLADRIDALREGKVETMAHSRVSDLHDRDMPSPSSAISASAFASFSTNTSADRRAAGGRGEDAVRRSGVLVGSVLSPSSSSTRSAGTSTSSSARRREHEKLVDDSFDAELLSSGTQSVSTAASQRDVSFGSNYSHGQFEDADDLHSRSRKGDNRKPLNNRDSVEF